MVCKDVGTNAGRFTKPQMPEIPSERNEVIHEIPIRRERLHDQTSDDMLSFYPGIFL